MSSEDYRSMATLPSGRRVSRLTTSQELEGLFDYSRSLASMAAEAAQEDEYDEYDEYDYEDDEEENEEDDEDDEHEYSSFSEIEEKSEMKEKSATDETTEFQKQCLAIKEMLPCLEDEVIEQTVRISRSPDYAFSILFDYVGYSLLQPDEGNKSVAVSPSPAAVAAAVVTESKTTVEPSQSEIVKSIMEVVPSCSEERVVAMLNKYEKPDEALNHLLSESMEEEDPKHRNCSV